MVELMVAMAVSLLISLIALASLGVARQGFSTVDVASQLRDNMRFTADMVRRQASQAGYKDTLFSTREPTPAEIAQNISAGIEGFNNALLATGNDPLNASPPFTTRASGTDGFGSDVLIFRYQAVALPTGGTDNSVIDCNGNSINFISNTRNDRAVSILHVAMSQGEISLMCTYSTSGLAPFITQPLVQGVENFQVLYGTDGVTPVGETPNPATSTPDSVPERFLRADQMVVTGNASATQDNWRRVRSLRIGMVVRGPLNSQQERVAQTFYPFGNAKSSSSGSVGSALSSANDQGTVFNAPADGRLRQTLTFTVHLPNDQGL